MALRLLVPISETKQVQVEGSLGAAYTKGDPIIINTVYAFSPNSYTTSDVNPYFIAMAGLVEVDADALDYDVGEEVFDDDTTPTGQVNKTSGAGRISVGKVAQEKDLTGGAGKLVIQLNGGGFV